MMHPEVREVLHELRQLAAILARITQQEEPMTRAIQDAITAFNLAVQQFDGTKDTIANELNDVKSKVAAFVASVPDLINQAIANANGDQDAAVAALQSATAKLTSDGADLAASVAASATAITAELNPPAAVPPVAVPPAAPPDASTPPATPPAPDAPPVPVTN